MRITVVGLGYVGLVTATCLARLGHEVIGLESDRSRVEILERGEVPYYEPRLADELAVQRKSKTVAFTTDPRTALLGSEAILVCVGTPSDASGRADLRYVLEVADTLAENLDGAPVVALRSTVPVGTTRLLERRLNDALEQRGHVGRVAVIANPEFLRTGRAIEDFLRPTRIVLGRTDLATQAHVDRLAAIYRPLDAPLVVTDAESAELVKNAANTFLAMKISFVNELANLCDVTGASIDAVVEGIALDPRIGRDFLRPGLGYGGSCLPKDVRSLIAMGAEHGSPMQLARAIDEVNGAQPSQYARGLEQALGGDLTGLRIAILGLAFKPDTDDIRDSPAIALARQLRDRGAIVVACDPQAGERARAAEPWLEVAAGPLKAADRAHAVVLATEWPAYLTLDLTAIAAAMDGRLLMDARDALDPALVGAAGLSYLALARGTSSVNHHVMG